MQEDRASVSGRGLHKQESASETNETWRAGEEGSGIPSSRACRAAGPKAEVDVPMRLTRMYLLLANDCACGRCSVGVCRAGEQEMGRMLLYDASAVELSPQAGIPRGPRGGRAGECRLQTASRYQGDVARSMSGGVQASTATIACSTHLRRLQRARVRFGGRAVGESR